MDAKAISAQGIGKWYRQRRGGDPFCVLQDINFEVKKGEFVSLIGSSGCGKTTLLRILAGLIRAEKGVVALDGLAIKGVPSDIGFVFQDPALLAWESLAQNVDIGLRAKKLSSSERASLVRDELQLMGLSGFEHYRPYQVSGGMQQRVGLARALVGRPGVLFLDEPLGALDAFTRLKLQDELSTILAATQCTVVLVTHDIEEALLLSDRIVIMGAAPGRIREEILMNAPRPRERVEFLARPDVLDIKARVLSLIMEERSAVEVPSSRV